MRKTLTTAALLLAFCCPAFAGEMGTPGSPAPPPSTAPSDGINQTGNPAPADGDGIVHGDDAETVTQIMLTLLVSVLP